MGWKNSSSILAIALAAVLTACGGQDEDQTELPEDRTPSNAELALPFRGDVPELAAGADGTLHLLFRRRSDGALATLYYARKAPTEARWTEPVVVPGSQNAAFRWFGWPKVAAGPDGQVHIAWTVEPVGGGLYYTGCSRCDGSDWRMGPDGQPLKLGGEPVTFLGLCAGEDRAVHLVASQYRAQAGAGRPQPEETVHYLSTDGGAVWHPARAILTKGSEADLAVTCTGRDVHLLLLADTLVHATYSSGTGAWTVQPALPTAGSVDRWFDLLGPRRADQIDGYVYAARAGSVPPAVYFGMPGQAPLLLSSGGLAADAPNNVLAARSSEDEKALALWSDADGRLHYNRQTGGAWAGDRLLSEAVRPLELTQGLARTAVYRYAAGHGWQSRIIWNAAALAEHDGSFHVVFRTPAAAGDEHDPVDGAFHYIRFRPTAD